MADYLAEGKLNPKAYPTKAGFLKHFAAWIIEEDLPFTTGEAPGLHRLFKYLEVTYQLPSDTTVRNVLAKIYAELHAEVVRELSVSHYSTILKCILTMPTEREIEDRVRQRQLDYTPDGLYLCWDHRLFH